MCAARWGSGDATSPRYRRVLWVALAVNALMFVVEIIGVAAGSSSLQADTLDLLGDAANYGISLFVLSAALVVRAGASMVMGVIGVLALLSLCSRSWARGRARIGPPSPGFVATCSTSRPLSLIVAIGIDFLLDGLLLGVGFAAGARIGILLAIAEGAEQLSVGLALAGELRALRMARGRILLIVSALGSLVFVTAVLGATVLSGLSDGLMEIVLAFGAAALLYLVTEELLREAHEEKETTTSTAMFFLGFLAFLVIGMVLE